MHSVYILINLSEDEMDEDSPSVKVWRGFRGVRMSPSFRSCLPFPVKSSTCTPAGCVMWKSRACRIVINALQRIPAHSMTQISLSSFEILDLWLLNTLRLESVESAWCAFFLSFTLPFISDCLFWWRKSFKIMLSALRHKKGPVGNWDYRTDCWLWSHASRHLPLGFQSLSGGCGCRHMSRSADLQSPRTSHADSLLQ